MSIQKEDNLIIKQIKDEMKRKKITLRKLSKMSSVAPSTIYDVLENRGSPRLITLQDICNALDMEIRVCKKSIKDNEWVEIFLNLSKQKREIVENIIILLDKYDALE